MRLFLFLTLFLLLGCSGIVYQNGTKNKVYSFNSGASLKQRFTQAAVLEKDSKNLVLFKNGQILPLAGDVLYAGKDFAIYKNSEGFFVQNATVKRTIDTFSFVASAAFNNKLLAVLLKDNSFYIYDTQIQKQLFKSKTKAPAVFTKEVASAIFYKNFIIFGTLDGKLITYDIRRNKITKETFINGIDKLNNVTFLTLFNGALIAATPRGVFSFVKHENFFDTDVFKIFVTDNKIYIFTKAGEVIETTLDLKVLQKTKFQFASFETVGFKDGVFHILEKEGYYFTLSKDFKHKKIYKASFKSDVFAASKSFYFDNKRLFFK